MCIRDSPMGEVKVAGLTPRVPGAARREAPAPSAKRVRHEGYRQRLTALHPLALGAGDDPRPRAGTKGRAKLGARSVAEAITHARRSCHATNQPTTDDQDQRASRSAAGGRRRNTGEHRRIPQRAGAPHQPADRRPRRILAQLQGAVLPASARLPRAAHPLQQCAAAAAQHAGTTSAHDGAGSAHVARVPGAAGAGGVMGKVCGVSTLFIPPPLAGEGGERSEPGGGRRDRKATPPRSRCARSTLPFQGRDRKLPLTGPHHFFGLGADAGDAFDLERRAAGFLGDFAVLLDQKAERGRVLLQAAQKIGRHAPVGALRAVLIDDVEEHELAFGIGSRFLGHGRCPFSIPSFRVPASGRPRNDELNDSHSTTKKKNPAQARGFSSRLVSDRLQIGSGRLAVLAICFDVERKLLALVEIAHAGALDCRDVNEHIRPAAVLHDEAEALLGVEELNGTCGHSGLLLKTLKGVNAPYKPFVWASYPDSACSWGRPSSGETARQAKSELGLYRDPPGAWQSPRHPRRRRAPPRRVNASLTPTAAKRRALAILRAAAQAIGHPRPLSPQMHANVTLLQCSA